MSISAKLKKNSLHIKTDMPGLVYIFTGEGKGKTSAALGMALRAVLAGLKVSWIAWYKDPSWRVSEYDAPKLLGKNFTMYIGGKGFDLSGPKMKRIKTGVVVDNSTPEGHKQAALGSLKLAKQILKEQKVDLLICDELCQAAGDRLIELKEVVELFKNRGKTHLVLTGRHCPQELIDLADTVTEMKKIKHAYDKGIAAVKGLDF